MIPPLCCPDGYFYNNTNNVCVNSITLTGAIPPITCPCCPVIDSTKFTYINPTGWFYNPYLNSVMQIISWTGGAVSEIYNKCVFTQTAPAAYGVPNPTDSYDPIDCPCCPKGYIWDPTISTYGMCAGTSAAMVTDPIPCIVCVCTPPPPFVCTTCGTSGQRIVFQFNFNTRNCTACVPDPFNPPGGKINCFIPNTLIDPDTSGFKLKQ